MANLKDKLKQIPKEPGVYQFLNEAGEVIYVGKAKNLKNRVGQYFGHHDNRPQLPYLMQEAADINYTVVTNELESLFLENTLIKQYYPKYNIQLRDDKNYAFITIDYRSEIPQIGYARKFENPLSNKEQGETEAGRGSVVKILKTLRPENNSNSGSKSIRYFGPYSAAWKIRNTLNLIRRIFPYCAHKEQGNRACFYYYLHRCPGICIGKITMEEYCLQLDRICWFLSGHTGKIVQELKNEMAIASSQQHYEKAARLRDQLMALELLQEKQNVIMPKPVSWDIVSLAEDSGYACINLFKVREGKMTDKENFVFEVSDPDLQIAPGPTDAYGFSNTEADDVLKVTNNEKDSDIVDPKQKIIQTFLEQYYLETSDVPKTIFTQIPSPDQELINHIIRSRFDRKTGLSTPQKGKPKELVDLGITNAHEHLKNWLQSQAGHLDKINIALAELKTHLSLRKTPERIECYDISNIQGTNPVGSMVVFQNGLPAKSEYRKFKIQGKTTPDDFAMMKEMLERRAERLLENDPKWAKPDVIVIDGGKGQLGVAVEVLKEKGLEIPVVGLAKRIEEIFFPNNPEPLILSPDNPGLQLLQRLRDETHRFGITFHRQLRSKQAVKSALDSIPGIGPKTKKLLKQKFGTVANIRKASKEELVIAVGEHIAELLKKSL